MQAFARVIGFFAIMAFVGYTSLSLTWQLDELIERGQGDMGAFVMFFALLSLLGYFGQAAFRYLILHQTANQALLTEKVS